MPKLCTFYEYKAHCWSKKKTYQPKITSRAKSPPNVWYTTYAQRVSNANIIYSIVPVRHPYDQSTLVGYLWKVILKQEVEQMSYLRNHLRVYH